MRLNDSPDRFIASCRSGAKSWERKKKLSTDLEKGVAFESFTQLCLQTAPEYLLSACLIGSCFASVKNF